MKAKSLPADKLCPSYPASRIPWRDSAAIRQSAKAPLPQPRALKALDLALAVSAPGYNVYVSGPENLGRTYMLRQYLEDRAKRMPTPPDLVYVNNFADPDTPRLLTLPAGVGRRFKDAVAKAVAEIRRRLPARLEHSAYLRRHDALQRRFQDVRTDLLHEMDKLAKVQGFNLDVDDGGGLTLYPLIEGKRLSEEEFRHLEFSIKQRVRRKGDTLMQNVSGLVRKLSEAERRFHDDEQGLDRETMAAVLDAVLTPEGKRLLALCHDDPKVDAFLRDLREDVLENRDLFLPKDAADLRSGQAGNDDPYRYDVNLFVDHAPDSGAPIVMETNPTSMNLLGCIERESEMGNLVTDFTLVKAGSLHKANGGFLLLRIEDVLQHPSCWDGLLRALRSGAAGMEESSDLPDGVVRNKGIAPDPIPLSLKVILIGNDDVYDLLLLSDPRFGKLFKIKAQLADVMPLSPANVRLWLTAAAHIARREALPPFDRDAMARLVDYSLELTEDRTRMSLRFPAVRDAMVEASVVARAAGHEAVSRDDLSAALADRIYRVNLIEDEYLEEYDRDLIKIRTDGEEVGRVNGLSVSSYGDFEFGLPHCISCTVGVGHGGIIDLEREAELGGPIHTKAMLILKSYLTGTFARNKPLVMAGSLCFEQNYGEIEGDSASGAELAALLSAVSGVPIRLSYAFTGAVNQAGQIMAVGGVSRKIEGFFKICARRGLTGRQGVIIPADNVNHLMLSRDVRDAVSEGRFAVIPVSHITEAMEILTETPAGRPTKEGFTRGSLYAAVDERLKRLGILAEHAFDKVPRKGR